MQYTSFVDPFLGNGEIHLPEPGFPASTWRFIKGLSGNTAPAAVLPFGKYSCMGYSGGYPTGYGVNDENCGGPIRKIFEKPHFVGLSHFHHNGTGAVGVYYNYALSHPFLGNMPDFRPREVLEERAVPGYFSAEIENIISEATVSEYVAAHRYTFAEGGGVAIDFANDVLQCGAWRAEQSGSCLMRKWQLKWNSRELLYGSVCGASAAGLKDCSGARDPLRSGNWHLRSRRMCVWAVFSELSPAANFVWPCPL